MIVILFIIIAILLFIIILQYLKQRALLHQLRYISMKIKDIIDATSTEKILVVTNQPDLQYLLNQINRILTYQEDTSVTFNHQKTSIKKMLANISHDLKTPLTVVLGYIETITEDTTLSNEEKNKMLAQINEKVLEIIELMNSFFDLAKLEAGDKQYSLSSINMNEVCKNNLLMFYDLIQDKKLEISIDIREEPIYALANEEAFNRVLTNLLSNAIYYGSDGGYVGLTLSQDATQVYVTVWDQGKGIDTEHQTQVFDRLFTLEESRNKSFQGSGLGLTITKQLVEEMDGTIELESIPFDKTEFSITFKRFAF